MLLLLLACGTKTDDTGSPTGPCSIVVEGTLPADGSAEAYYRGPFEFQLSAPDPTAVASASFAGTSSRSEDNTVVYYTPDAPLEPGQAYSVDLDYCGGSDALAFSTSALGTPLDTDLVGRTWAFDLASARIVTPEGMAAVLNMFPAEPLLLGVVAASDTELTIIEGTGFLDAIDQDYCAATTELPPGDFSEQPYFSVVAETAGVQVSGVPVTVRNVTITGTFAADGSEVGGGTLSSILDTRPLAPLVGGTEPGSACEVMISLGIVCEPCPTDSEPYCVTLIADQITAPEVPGVTVAPIAGTDCTGCEAGPPAPDATCAE